MTDIEERLRGELKAAAGRAQPHLLRELTPPPPGRLRGSARWLAPVAAVLAVALVVLGVRAILRAGPAGPGPAGPAQLPRFYVAVAPGSRDAVVARSATGAVISRVVIPGATVGWVSAASDDRTFALSASTGSGAAEVTRFYQVRLSAGGRPGGLTVLPLTVRAGSAGYGVNGIALSPDGSRLAVAVVPAALLSNRPSAAHRSRIEIATLGTSAAGTWVGPAYLNISNLSWTDGGRRLGYLSDYLRGFPRRPDVTRMYLLDPSRPGQDQELSASSSAVALRTGTAPIDSALLTAAGHAVIAWAGPAAGSSAEILAEYSAATGQRTRVLYRGPGHGDFVVQGELLSTDPSGRHLLVGYLTARGDHLVLARLDNGRLTVLPSLVRSLQPTRAAW